MEDIFGIQIINTQIFNKWNRRNWRDNNGCIEYCNGFHQRSEECEWTTLTVKDIETFLEEIKTI